MIGIDPDLYSMAQRSASSYGVPFDLFSSIINAESRWNPNATNAASGAMGLGQVLRSTARDPGYGVKPLTAPYDPQSNLDFAASYLSAMFRQTGSWFGATQRYSGSGNAVPYQGNSLQGPILAALNGAGAVNSAAAGTAGGTGECWYYDPSAGHAPCGTPGTSTVPWGGPGNFDVVTKPLANLASSIITSQTMLVVVGIILLIGAMLYFSRNQ